MSRGVYQRMSSVHRRQPIGQARMAEEPSLAGRERARERESEQESHIILHPQRGIRPCMIRCRLLMRCATLPRSMSCAVAARRASALRSTVLREEGLRFEARLGGAGPAHSRGPLRGAARHGGPVSGSRDPAGRRPTPPSSRGRLADRPLSRERSPPPGPAGRRPSPRQGGARPLGILRREPSRHPRKRTATLRPAGGRHGIGPAGSAARRPRASEMPSGPSVRCRGARAEVHLAFVAVWRRCFEVFVQSGVVCTSGSRNSIHAVSSCERPAALGSSSGPESRRAEAAMAERR